MSTPPPQPLQQFRPQLIESQLIKQIIQTRIKAQLNHIPTPKCLYAHKQILNTINFIFDFKFQTLGITGNIYEFVDDPKAIDTDPASNVVFLIYAKPQSMSTIASIILHNESSFVKKQYHLLFVPVVDYLCEQELKRIGVWEKVQIKKLDFNFIPFTESLFSLQLPQHLTSIEAECSIVESILKLEFMRGSFKNILGKGRAAKSILEHLQARRSTISQIKENEQDYDVLIVLDRKVDMVTPLLTGLSYECLLDFFFTINKNKIDVPGKLFGSQKQIETFLLHNKKDPVYEEISCMNINDVPQLLRDRSVKLKQRIQEEKEKASDYQELNRLNNTLMVQYLLIQNHQALVLHILQQMKTIHFNNTLLLQSSILQGENAQTPFTYQQLQYLSLFYPIEHLLRLLCLHSQVSDQSRFYTKNEKLIIDFMLNVERIDQLPTLYNLIKAQILKQSKLKTNWLQTTHKFNLFPEEDHYNSYTHLNIIYSPLTLKTLQFILTNKLDPEKSSLIHKDTYFKGTVPRFNKINNIYVLMAGGISYNEISCLKILEKRMKKKVKVLTTEILGQNRLIKKHMFNPLAG